MKGIVIIALLMNAFLVKVQQGYPKVTIPNSHIRKITSIIVSGQAYKLQII